MLTRQSSFRGGVVQEAAGPRNANIRRRPPSGTSNLEPFTWTKTADENLERLARRIYGIPGAADETVQMLRQPTPRVQRRTAGSAVRADRDAAQPVALSSPPYRQRETTESVEPVGR